MHDVFSFLKSACGGVYHFAAGQVHCRREGLAAGAPSPLQSLIPTGDFNVPKGELEDVLRRVSEPEAQFDGESLVIRGGRLRAAVRADRDEPPPVPATPNDWYRVPDGLIEALEMAVNFTDDGMRWTAGVRLTEGRVTAVCSTGGIDVAVPEVVGRPVLLTRESIEFVIDARPDEMSVTDSALWCRWADGKWMRAQLHVGEMPGAVEGIFDGTSPNFTAPMGEAETLIDDEFRAAFTDAAALTDGAVELRPSGFYFARGAESGEAACATGLPDGHRSVWLVRALSPVMKYAKRWNPSGYPDPVKFEGDNFRGVVMGRR